ncbi:diguanylate cyclase domain-containing protein [Crenobacter caeni]|uniref:Diguanylate cyclase n=1 Tax=Crenobacter caeni TaxID=2705474 RepID=A0A6B2KSJ4_9NEIS|nr:diguanylate cyclase [Crenobacter caeni]NDV12907.1 diguanylate cyclase [Crenobacter caeni]
MKSTVSTHARHTWPAFDEAALFALLDCIPGTAIQAYTPDGTLVFWGAQSETLYGWPRSEAVGRKLGELFMPPEQAAAFMGDVIRALAQGGDIEPGVFSLQARDGRTVSVYSSHTWLRKPDGQVLLFCMDTDLTTLEAARQDAQRARRRLDFLLQTSGESVWEWYTADDALVHGPQAASLFGLPADQLPVSMHEQLELIAEADRERVRGVQAACLAGEERPLRVEYRLGRGEYAGRWFEERAHVIERDAAGQPSLVMGIVADVDERHRADDAIRTLAYYDPLTKLPNRRLLLERLQHAQALGERSGLRGAVLFLDLDGFKAVNDGYGHATGDLLLQAVATRLVACVRASDTVARLGGDEFVILLEQVAEGEAKTCERIVALADKLCQALASAFQLGEHSHQISTSIGISLFLGSHEDANALLEQADRALYRAKHAGRNTWRFHCERLQRRFSRSLLQAGSLTARPDGVVPDLAFYPRANARLEVVGATAAAALPGIRGGATGFGQGAQPPGLERQTLQLACDILARWQADPVLARLVLSVEVGAALLSDAGFARDVTAMLGERDLAATNLELVVDADLTDDARLQAARTQVRRLADDGVRVALTGFGATPLTVLDRLPAHALYLDETLTGCLGASSPALRAAIACARALGVDAVARNVQSARQFQRLRDAGGPLAEGPLFGQGRTLDAFEHWVLARSGRHRDEAA